MPNMDFYLCPGRHWVFLQCCSRYLQQYFISQSCSENQGAPWDQHTQKNYIEAIWFKAPNTCNIPGSDWLLNKSLGKNPSSFWNWKFSGSINCLGQRGVTPESWKATREWVLYGNALMLMSFSPRSYFNQADLICPHYALGNQWLGIGPWLPWSP